MLLARGLADQLQESLPRLLVESHLEAVRTEEIRSEYPRHSMNSTMVTNHRYLFTGHRASMYHLNSGFQVGCDPFTLSGHLLT